MTRTLPGWWSRLAAAATTAVLLVLLGAPAASAHAVVEGTDPADGQVLDRAPQQVTVTFNETITLAAQGTALLDADGVDVPAHIVAVDNTVRITPTGEMPDGTYIVTWRVISADTHPVAGGITFAVGAPSAAAITMPGRGTDPQVNLWRLIVEAVRYVGLLGFVGLVFFTLFIAGGAVGESESFAGHLRVVLRGLGIAAVASAVVAVPLVQAWQDGAGLGDLASPRLWGEAIGSAAAATALALVVGVVTAGIGLGGRAPVLAAAGMALGLGSLLIEGHTRSYGPAVLVLPADLLHITTAAVWLGGLIGLSMLLLADHRVPIRAVATAVKRFSTLAMWLVGGLGVAAIVLWWRIADSITALWTTYYGQLVLVKLGLATAVVAIAAWNRYRLVPAVVAASARDIPPVPAAGDRRAVRPPALTRLRRSVGAEALILIAVIGITTVLVSQNPTPGSAAVSAVAAQTATATADGITGEFTITPGTAGTNSLQLHLSDDDSRIIATYQGQPPDLSVALEGTDIGPFRHQLIATAAGDFEATVDLPLSGTWTITLVVRTGEFESSTLTTEVTIP